MNKYIYISSKKNQKEYLEDNFNNIRFVSKTPSKFSLKKIIKEIKKSNINQVIIEDYFVGINNFIEKLNKLDKKVKMVWTGGLATLNDEIELENLTQVLSLLKEKKIKNLAFKEENIYEVYKALKGVKKISLTVKGINKHSYSKNRCVSIYGDAYDWRSNYFNQLSALKLIDNYNLLILDSKNIVNRFCKFFNIKNLKSNKKFDVKNFRKLLNNLDSASCVEFSNSLDLFVIDSYNHGVPVVLGNNNLFFKDTELSELVVVKSDDDVNEIAEKLNYCLNNSKNIIEMYKKLKTKYDLECRNLINDFIEE